MFIQFESNKIDKRGFQNIIFENPLYIISCFHLSEVKDCIDRMDDALGKGCYLAGFFSYEMGYAFEQKLFSKNKYDFPLIWFGVFKCPNPGRPTKSNNRETKGHFKNLRLNVSKNEYYDSINKIKKLISRGQTYQVNYTLKYKFNFTGNPLNFYEALKDMQSVPYSAFIDGEDFNVISLSPEMFLIKTGRNITVEPMKGTISRGVNLKEDNARAHLLKTDIKNRSENIMIVDLLRNDLGRVAENGSVKAAKLFEIKKYETLLQMTSRISAKIEKNIKLYDLFSSVFPSGSVTGAPKMRTMEIIKSMEKEDRNIYTGSIGYITPKKDMVFNIAIRTILLSGNKGELGIGSGIIADSIAANEYDECKLKADFFTKSSQSFDLIETLLCEKGRFRFLNGHMSRLNNSAEYFGFKFDKKAILTSLRNAGKSFELDNKYKVRILLSKNGFIKISYSAIVTDLDLMAKKKIIIFSEYKTRSDNAFLFHKTSNRQLYDSEFRKYSQKGFFDVIFRNEKSEVTEGAVSNIFIKKRNNIYTPPVSCGLLNGVFRQYLINKKERIIEKILYESDLNNADEILLCNSVKGISRVVF